MSLPASYKSLLTGRAAGKLRRNRLAMVALAIISLYILVGVWLFAADAYADIGKRTGWWGTPDGGLAGALTALTLTKVEGVVGPLSAAGLGSEQKPEKRLRDAKFMLDEFRKALRPRAQEDKAAAISAIRFGERRISLSPAQLKETYDRAKDLYDRISQSPNVDDDPSLLPKIEALESEVDSAFAPLSGIDRAVYHFRLSLGTDRQGRSVAARAVYSVKVALQIGIIVAVVSVLIGSFIGAAAGYFGGWVDHAATWLYSTLSSVPDLVLLAVLAFMFTGSYFDDPSKPFLSLVPVYASMCMTFWIGPCRVVRGETMKLKQLEYVQAATAIGFGRVYILLRHILPNTLHLAFINFSLLFIAAIKFEVVLSFLNLGVKAGPSWGRMIGESTQEVINGFFWQIGAATLLMFVLVLSFNILSDALQDAFDPKHVG